MNIVEVTHEELQTTITYDDGHKITMPTIEALLYHVMLISEEQHRREFLSVIRLDSSTISRIKSGEYQVSDKIILRLHEYTGIPVSELRLVSNTKSFLDLEF